MEGCVCPYCQYELKGVTACMCPECGQLFEVSEVRSKRLQDPPKMPWCYLFFVLLSLGFLYLGMLAMQLYTGALLGALMIGLGLNILWLPLVYSWLVDEI